MNRSCAPRTVTTAWLAMAALLLGALLPLLSHTLARSAHASGWVEVCTSTGMAWVHTETGQRADAPPYGSLASDVSDCTWCLLQAGAGGLPVAADAPHFGPVASAARHPQADSPLPAQAHWPSALTRAPPVQV